MQPNPKGRFTDLTTGRDDGKDSLGDCICSGPKFEAAFVVLTIDGSDSSEFIWDKDVEHDMQNKIKSEREKIIFPRHDRRSEMPRKCHV
jgi:hypothetical protein